VWTAAKNGGKLSFSRPNKQQESEVVQFSDETLNGIVHNIAEYLCWILKDLDSSHPLHFKFNHWFDG